MKQKMRKIASKMEDFMEPNEEINYPPWGLAPLDKKSVREVPYPEMSDKHLDDVKWLGQYTSVVKSSNNFYYHVTPAENVESILEHGLLPKSPEDLKDRKAVYLFPDKATAEEALMNWLGDRFEDEDLALLKINKDVLQEQGIKIIPGEVGYELMSLQPIPPGAISVEEMF